MSQHIQAESRTPTALAVARNHIHVMFVGGDSINPARSIVTEGLKHARKLRFRLNERHVPSITPRSEVISARIYVRVKYSANNPATALHPDEDSELVTRVQSAKYQQPYQENSCHHRRSVNYQLQVSSIESKIIFSTRKSVVNGSL